MGDKKNSVLSRTIKLIKKRKENIENGKINSIPTPFKRFQQHFLGVEQGKMYLITAGTKASKTQLTSFLFLYNSLFFYLDNPTKIKLKIFYFPLEETPELVTARFICHLLYKLSGGTIKISRETLLSSTNEALPTEVLDMILSQNYLKYLEAFQEMVTFSQVNNPTGIYYEVKNYIKKNGTSYYGESIKIQGDFGTETEVKKFSHYVPNNPDEWVIFLVDHVGEMTIEKGLSKKENIDKLGDYCIELRNKYNVTSILIQQQLVNENTDNFKLQLLRPTITNLQDSKYLAQKANLVIGIFSPMRYQQSEYFGYNILIFKDNIRFIEILANRDGVSNGITALYFDGMICHFEQLPPPNDPAIEKYYQKIEGKTENLM